ncbi:TPA: hypothetical protein N0F65_001114 [Lagenidium giganteum]|uniref:Uncharacterized protein n=1 Tax=Lagenidium giganteum TaxID=4803 RepID=A0AAV2YJZ3_9STRA|nr:TPA: hypothetical protein N0F65_001114 [Lagenidium giganteum]
MAALATTATAAALADALEAPRRRRTTAANEQEALTKLYKGLQEAKNRVDQVLIEDSKSPDLYDQLSTQSEPQNYFFEPYATQWCPQLIKKGSVIPLPAVVAASLDDTKTLTLSGLLQPIDHAWTSVDTKLFLWNYKKRGQFTVFEFDQAIVAVGLCLAPVGGVFTDKVHHLLVVATTVEVILVAMLYENNDRQTGAIKLQRTKLSVSTDNCVVRRILATAAGRVFFAGSDGGLYEFLYGPDDGAGSIIPFFHKPCRKVSHTTNYANYLPGFLVGLASSPGKVIEAALDDERNILYVLHDNAQVSVYDLGVAGDDTKLVCSIDLLASGAKYARDNRRTRVSCPDERIFQSTNMKVVSLAVVPRDESAFVNLVAVSSNGIRFYLTVYSRSAYTVGSAIPKAKRPTRLDIVFIRLPPPAVSLSDAPPYHAKEGMQPGFAPGKSPSTVHAAFHRKGVFLMVDGGKDQQDQLIGVAHDPITSSIATQASRKSTIRESLSLDSCAGKVAEIEELASDDVFRYAPSSSSSSASRPSAGAKRSFEEMSNGITSSINESVPIVGEMARQYSEPSRHFLCLTNAGIQVFKKIRPIDQLHRMLLLARGSELKATLAPFIRSFGEVQVCSMLIGLACGVASDPALNEAAYVTQRAGVKSDDYVYSSAMQGIFECGQAASNAIQSDANRPEAAASTRIVMTTEFEMSCQHDGLVMFMSRVMRPLLYPKTLGKRALVRIQGSAPANSKGPAPSGFLRTFELVHSNAKLDEIREVLFQLRQLMESAGPYAVSISTGSVLEKTGDLTENGANGSSRVSELANRYHKQRNEEQLRREKRFKQEQRSLFFLYQMVLRSIEGISLLRMISEYNVALEESLARLSFNDFISTADGMNAAKTMIKTLMKGRNENNQFLIKQLREQCPSFFSVADLWHYQGHKSLAMAKLSAPSGRSAYLKESLSQFLNSCYMWDTEDCIDVLQGICEDYMMLNFYEGIVKLALACAKNFNDAAASDLSGIKLKWKRSCFGCILLALQRLMDRSDSGRSKNGQSPQAVDDMVNLDDEARAKYVDELLHFALASEDGDFHELLYAWLYENAHTQLLTSLRSPFIENFLKERDQDLLIKLYMDQQKYLVAAKVWWNRAYEDDSETNDLQSNPDIVKRQYYISKALGCLKSVEDTAEAADAIREVRDVLDVLQLQVRVLKTLEQHTIELEVAQSLTRAEEEEILERKDDIRQLTFKIFDATTLYNQFASKYDMWSECLHIIHACNSEDSDVISSLWSKILYSLIPTSSSNNEFNAWRAAQCDRAELPVQWHGATSFESGMWIGQLQCKLLRLGKSLYFDSDDRQAGATLGSFVFPVGFLAKELEQIASWYQQLTHSGGSSTGLDGSTFNWVLKMFVDVGVPYRILLSHYEQIYREQGTLKWSTHLLQSMLSIVTLWKKHAVSPRASKDLLADFAASCPHLVDMCDDFITDLKTVPLGKSA